MQPNQPQRFKQPQQRKREAKRKQPSGVDGRTAQSSSEFNAKHPRDANGRFGSGGGSGGGGTKPQPKRPDKNRLKGRKIPLLGRRLKRVKELEAEHDKRFKRFLGRLPVSAAGMSLSDVKGLVERARKKTDAELQREGEMYRSQAEKLRKAGNYEQAYILDAQAATMNTLVSNRERIRGMSKAERYVADTLTRERVKAWNAVPQKHRVKLARKKGKDGFPGAGLGYVIKPNGHIAADDKGFRVDKPKKKPKPKPKAKKPKSKKDDPSVAPTPFKLPKQNKP